MALWQGDATATTIAVDEARIQHKCNQWLNSDDINDECGNQYNSECDNNDECGNQCNSERDNDKRDKRE